LFSFFTFFKNKSNMRFTSPALTGAIRAAYQNRLVSQVTKVTGQFPPKL
jgi:hypothetical protein